MTVFVTVGVPEKIEQFSCLLQTFFEGMIAKLEKNAHKETPTVASLGDIMDLLIEEIVEFEEQLALDKFDENSLIELMDQANFAFLAYVALRRDGVKHGTAGGVRLPSCGCEKVGDTSDNSGSVSS